jgi:hypothetical protein
MEPLPMTEKEVEIVLFLRKYPEWANAPIVGLPLLVLAEKSEPEKFKAWSKEEVASRSL